MSRISAGSVSGRIILARLDQQHAVAGRSLRRAASTQPAEPAPTMRKSYGSPVVIMGHGVDMASFSGDLIDQLPAHVPPRQLSLDHNKQPFAPAGALPCLSNDPFFVRVINADYPQAVRPCTRPRISGRLSVSRRSRDRNSRKPTGNRNEFSCCETFRIQNSTSFRLSNICAH